MPDKAHAVIGMRRAGKTTFLRQLLAERRSVLPPERALYLSFDDDRLAGIEVEQLGFLLEEFYRRHPALRGRETVHWLFDEIQLVPGWERFVRRVMDSEKVDFVVSGSSARMLSREVHTSLRGRGMETVIRPFSFREFLRHRDEEPAKPAGRWTAAERSRVEKRFREFLTEGGFPEVQGLSAPLRIELLQGYVDTVLFRDVVERFRVSQVAALRWLVRHCLRNAAGSFSVHRLTFLGYTFGPEHYRRTGRWYLAASPSRRSVQRVKAAVRAVLRPGNQDRWPDVAAELNRRLRGWATYFNYGTRGLAYRAIDQYVADAVRAFLRRRHKVSPRGTRRVGAEHVFGAFGVQRLASFGRRSAARA